jgi:hypothetical protein
VIEIVFSVTPGSGMLVQMKILAETPASSSSRLVAGKLHVACGTLFGKYFLKCAASGAVGVPLPALPVSSPRWQSQ